MIQKFFRKVLQFLRTYFTHRSMKEPFSPGAMAIITDYANRLIRRNLPLPLLRKGGDFPFIAHALEAHFLRLKEQRDLRLPDLSLDNQTVAVFSDFGGDHPESKVRSYSFLFASYNQLHWFKDQMALLRAKHRLDNPYKEIAFKDLRYGPLHRALDEYLLTLNNLVPGFLLTLIIDKDVAKLFTTGTDGIDPVNALKSAGLGVWPQKEAERVLRIMHSLAYLISLLASDGQKVFWMTDDDAIVANDERKRATGNLLQRLLGHYSKNKYSTVGMATPFDEEYFLHDLLSAPDLAAGAIEHYFSNKKAIESKGIRQDVDKILVWMAYEGISLRRDVIRIKKSASSTRGLDVVSVTFSPTLEAKNVVQVPLLR